jgi:3'-5' exoribonuclease
MIKTFDLNEVNNNDVVVVDLMVKNIEIKPTKNNKLFIEGEGINNNLNIDFKIWDATNELFEKIKDIKFIRIKGHVNEYQNNKQIIVENYKEIPSDHIDLKDYVPSTNLNIDEIKTFISNIINSINNENYKKIINELLVDEFYIHGAAVNNHHNINGGLLEHTYQMLISAKSIIENDISNLYKNINKDLLFTSIILHDIGKLEELDGNEYGIIEKYSIAGELLGHIVIGCQKITEVCFKNNINIYDKDIILLNHCIISHHGKPEWGSVRYPMIPEAQLLFQLDYNSTYMDMFNNVLETLNEDEFSKRQFLMDNRKLFKK